MRSHATAQSILRQWKQNGILGATIVILALISLAGKGVAQSPPDIAGAIFFNTPTINNAGQVQQGAIKRIDLPHVGLPPSGVVSGLNYPSGLTLDAAGNLYFGNVTFNPLRLTLLRRNPTGAIATLRTLFESAGSTIIGAWAFDVAVNSDHELFFNTPTINNAGQIHKGTIQKIDLLDTGLPPSIVVPDLDYPSGLALDAAGNLYFGNVTFNPLRLTLLQRDTTEAIENLRTAFDGAGGSLIIGAWAFDMTAGASAYTLKAGIGDDPAAPGIVTETTPILGTTPITAQFPLGSVFFLQLVDPQGQPVSSTFTLGTATINPTITGATLFPNNVVIGFDLSGTGDTQIFQSVHKGTVLFTITPEDTSIAPVQVNVQIVVPEKLGKTENQYDSTIIAFGHQNGIPPQFLKGQIQKESGFNPLTHRYEPITVDYKYMSSCNSRHRPCNLRAQPPYADYRLQTKDGLSQGRLTNSDDFSTRSNYCIFDTNENRKRILPTDSFISSQDIFLANDVVPPHDPTDCFSWNWTADSSRSPLIQAVQRNPILLDFTAQTSIAASYGLLQILYPTAINPMQWEGINGDRNPTYLWDTQANLTAGGGSLKLGTAYFQECFRSINQANADSPMFLSSTAAEESFRKAYNCYNGIKPHSRTGLNIYGNLVLQYSEDFLPTSSQKIFQ